MAPWRRTGLSKIPRLDYSHKTADSLDLGKLKRGEGCALWVTRLRVNFSRIRFFSRGNVYGPAKVGTLKKRDVIYGWLRSRRRLVPQKVKVISCIARQSCAGWIYRGRGKRFSLPPVRNTHFSATGLFSLARVPPKNFQDRRASRPASGSISAHGRIYYSVTRGATRNYRRALPSLPAFIFSLQWP